ncbi:SIS domain-containing protein [Truepera radiovictrix]|uniref:Glutamine--fructose-6-phosphate transaminase (Isomerizing) n=1 Tax=Truepera radiovictrix (strain DSM 17093 / CIP 108686 / LMG 22925 / RQ-24) TaxID=649638 RepID=D7CTF4_TRURR|nr:SIS domain-containing protein [Truepera radiovictrix]ADI13811.1 Glutamine--fructose-6-phosphate transaminase (isomerizing) [Truepera radiovictrix DSM 17093]WMT57624.1 SIS domain-containing protein [Truepera radiovictrix]
MTERPTSHFEREIYEQPEVLANLLEGGPAQAAVQRVAQALRERPPALIATLARGSSDNAVTFFTYLAGQTLGLPVASLPPSLLSVYRSNLRLQEVLGIGVSQSGESSDVVEGLRALKAAGATTVAVTNRASSALERAAHHTLLQGAGTERAVAASKTVTSQMLLLALLVAHWGEDAALLNALKAVPEQMQRLLGAPAGLEHLALRLTHARSAYVLGRGLSYGPALETALKLKETAYVQAQAYSSAEFQHGPIAAVNPTDPVLMLALDDGTLESNLEAERKLLEVGADLSALSSDPGLCDRASAAVRLPSGLHPVTQSFLLVLAGQLLALYLTRAKGLDPDAPRHLNKVTKTM